MQIQDDLNTLGKRLAYLRERTGINQQKLSDATGVSRSNLSKYEQDKVKPTSDAIVSLCNFYDISADWLLRGKEVEQSETQKIEAVFDPDLKRMIDVLKELMESDNPHMRSWAIIQFENAFKQQCAAQDEKKLHA